MRFVDFELLPCETCKGRGTVPCPPTVSSIRPNERGHFLTPGYGKPIPCPTCKGKRNRAVRKDSNDKEDSDE